MTEHQARGNKLRSEAKAIVLEFMHTSDICQPGHTGMRLASISRACGFDWGTYEKSILYQPTVLGGRANERT